MFSKIRRGYWSILLILALVQIVAGERTPGCYLTEDATTPIDGCSCHESCDVCGYNADPSGAADCVTCQDASHSLTAIYTDGTGTCSPSTAGCYLTASLPALDDCTCHESCKACGYSGSPTGETDCASCANSAHVLTVVYTDGTGSCAAASAATPVRFIGLSVALVAIASLVAVY